MARLNKKGIAMIRFIIISALALSNCFGQEKEMKFVAGYITGQLIHEVGHIILLQANKTPWRFQNNVSSPIFVKDNPPSRHTFRIMGAGGFAAEIFSSELIFATSDLQSPFITGMVVQTIVNPIGYVWRDWTAKKVGFGDIENLQRGGIPKKYTRIVLLSHASINILRLYLKKKRSNIDIESDLTYVSVTYHF